MAGRKTNLNLKIVRDIRYQWDLDRRAGTRFATLDLLAKEYRVHRNTIADIIYKKTWNFPQAFPQI